MSETKATMFVFAGNNGSGKSTIRNLIVDQLFVVDNSKADGEFILEADQSGIKYYLNELPEWAQLIDRESQIKYKTQK